jgi:acyl-CoA thioester hydrolase
VLVRAEVDFTRPAVFDDTLDVRATCTAIGRSSFTLTFSVSKDGEDVEVSRASITYVNVDPETGRSRPVPDAVRAALGALGGEG